MEGKAKQDKGRHCRINATVTEEERAALDRLVDLGGFKSVSALIGALAIEVDEVAFGRKRFTGARLEELGIFVEKNMIGGVK